MRELLGLNRGRTVLSDGVQPAGGFRTASMRPAYGLTPEEVACGVFAWGEGITWRVLASGLPAIGQDVDAEPLFLFRTGRRAQLPPEAVALIALPIAVNGATVGVLGCHRIRSRQRHLNDDLALLRILATLTGQLLQLERVSQSQATVLLLGESGTGKELFARAVHLASGRRVRPFIKVNCSAIPETLFESGLFGHERGAFTGATVARAGWFEQAVGGTLFLDEIGELPLALQAKLLRTLQEGTLLRLGGTREIQADVRLVAATNRDLAREVQAGHFRQDLYYRLNVIPIRLPSLRERREDVRPLALHFVSRANQSHQRNVYLDPGALARLEAHAWPGNIRELGNLIERLVLLADHPQVSAEALERFMPEVVLPLPPASQAAGVGASELQGTPAGGVRDYQRAGSHSVAVLQAALSRHNGNQTMAAQSLGLTLRQFSYRLRKAGLR